jgi:hypothetical protein
VIFSLLSASLLALRGLLPGPPAKDPDCQQHVDRAYQQLARWQHIPAGQVLVLHFAAETTSRAPGKKVPTTSTSHFTLMSRPGQSYLATGDTEIYQDGKVQVSIARAQRTILLTASQPNTPNALSQWVQMREQVQHQTTITACTLPTSSQRLIVARPLVGSSLIGKVASITYLLDARTDALRKMTMYYPLDYGVSSVALVIESQQYTTQAASLQGSALSHVLGPDKQLLPAYRHYQLQDQR